MNAKIANESDRIPKIIIECMYDSNGTSQHVNSKSVSV